MKKLLVLLTAIILASCGSNIPEDIKYEILKEEPLKSFSKCNIKIILNKKVDEVILTEIAHELRKNRKEYDKLWISYYLSEMNTETIAWAVTNFTPSLEVEIIGSTEFDDKIMESKSSVNGNLIGKRENKQVTADSTMIYKDYRKLQTTKKIYDMNNLQITPQQAWLSLSKFWSSFSFLLVEGASNEQINNFETNEKVVLQQRVKDLISINSAFDIPPGYFLDFSAEATLSTIDTWVRFDNSEINTIMDDPDWWPNIFKENNLPSTSMKDYIIIGSNPWAADYGFYVMLHQDSNTVYSLDENIPEINLLGDIVNWLGECRLNNFKNVKEYVDQNNNESDNAGGEGIAKDNRFYLNLGYPNALARWNNEEAEFIKTFNEIAKLKDVIK